MPILSLVSFFNLEIYYKDTGPSHIYSALNCFWEALKSRIAHATGLQEHGIRILLFMVWMSGTVL
jgi:hypothetical protein